MTAGVSTIVAKRFDPMMARVAVRPFGSTIGEIIAEEMPEITTDAQRADLIVVVIVGLHEREITLDLWAFMPPEGAAVRVHLRLGKGIVKPLLAVAILAFAAWAGPLLFGGGLMGSLGTALIGGLGMFLLNTLIPVEAPKSKDSDPRYSINGSRNRNDPWGVIPEIHGSVRIFPKLLAQPYTEGLGEDRWAVIPGLLGYGDCEYDKWRIGETALEDFPDAELQIATIEPDGPWPFPSYLNPVFETEVDAYLRYEEPWTVRQAASNCDYFSIEWVCKQGLTSRSKKGDEGSRSIPVGLQYRQKGTVDWIARPDVVGRAATSETYSFGDSWLLPTPQNLEVRSRRLSNEQQSARDTDAVHYGLLRGTRPVRPFSFNKPIDAFVLRIRASAMAQGMLDQVNCVAHAVRPDWDPATQSWITRRTKSPAAAMRRILQGPANPDPAPDDDMDLEAYQDLAEFCIAKNLTFNMEMDQEFSVDEALRTAARAGRAFPVRPEGLHSLYIDRPQTVRRGVISGRNATNFAGEPQYVDRPDAFRVAFLDETDDFKKTERIIPRPGLVGKPKSFQMLDLPGVTNPTQLWIEGTRRHLEIERRWEPLSCEQGLASWFAQPGVLVAAQFQTVNERQATGKVLETLEGRLIHLDVEVSMIAGEQYACCFQQPTGEVFTRPVFCDPGVSRLILLDGVGPAPAAGAIALFGPAGQEAEEVVVRRIEPMKDRRVRLSFVAHAPEIEALAEASPPNWYPIEPEPRDWADKPPATPVIMKVLSGQATKEDFGDPDAPPIVVLVKPGSNGLAPTQTIEVAIGSLTDITGAGVGRAEFDGDDFSVGQTIQVTATAVSMFGVRSLAAAGPVPHVVQPADNGPDIEIFTAVRLSNGSNRYDFASDDPKAQGELRYALKTGTVPPAFADMTPVVTGYVTASPVTAELPSADEMYWAALRLTNEDDVASPPTFVTLDRTPDLMP